MKKVNKNIESLNKEKISNIETSSNITIQKNTIISKIQIPSNQELFNVLVKQNSFHFLDFKYSASFQNIVLPIEIGIVSYQININKENGFYHKLIHPLNKLNNHKRTQRIHGIPFKLSSLEKNYKLICDEIYQYLQKFYISDDIFQNEPIIFITKEEGLSHDSIAFSTIFNNAGYKLPLNFRLINHIDFFNFWLNYIFYSNKSNVLPNINEITKLLNQIFIHINFTEKCEYHKTLLNKYHCALSDARALVYMLFIAFKGFGCKVTNYHLIPTVKYFPINWSLKDYKYYIFIKTEKPKTPYKEISFVIYDRIYNKILKKQKFILSNKEKEAEINSYYNNINKLPHTVSVGLNSINLFEKNFHNLDINTNHLYTNIYDFEDKLKKFFINNKAINSYNKHFYFSNYVDYLSNTNSYNLHYFKCKLHSYNLNACTFNSCIFFVENLIDLFYNSDDYISMMISKYDEYKNIKKKYIFNNFKIFKSNSNITNIDNTNIVYNNVNNNISKSINNNVNININNNIHNNINVNNTEYNENIINNSINNDNISNSVNYNVKKNTNDSIINNFNLNSNNINYNINRYINDNYNHNFIYNIKTNTLNNDDNIVYENINNIPYYICNGSIDPNNYCFYNSNNMNNNFYYFNQYYNYNNYFNH